MSCRALGFVYMNRMTIGRFVNSWLSDLVQTGQGVSLHINMFCTGWKLE